VLRLLHKDKPLVPLQIGGKMTMKKNIAIGIMGILCISTFTACGRSNTDGRQIINQDSKQITILGKQNEPANNEIALKKIDSLKGIRALDWIDEDTLLIMKDNEQYPKIQLDSKKAYPKNLYEYNINTKELKLIAGSETDMGYAVLSPDKRYIFYKEGVEANLTGFILNRLTGQKMRVTNIDSIMNTEGRWIDNSNVIFSEFPQGGIYIANINGEVKPVENIPKGMVSNSAKLGDKIFYTTAGGNLYVQDIATKQNNLLKENVVWFIPTMYPENLAMVKRIEKTKMVLVITDMGGKEKGVLAEGTQIFGTSWSKDQSKIAYSVASDNSGKAGLFVSDINSGKTAQITVDIELVGDEVRWSLSGNKLLATNVIMENNEPSPVTYLIELK
jgi:TolB protein